MPGKLLIFSAPSGAGKTTIVKHLIEQNFNLEFSVSACSRPKRRGEVDKVDYYFLSVDEFKQNIKDNKFIEWEEVYKNHFYGTLKSEVERIWGKGNNAIFDVDVKGGLNIKKQYGDKALAVFVMPPSVEELKKRLLLRSTDSIKNINKRIEKAEYEITFADKFDKIIVNDDLDTTLAKAKKIVEDFLNN
ncbi:MAG: guanylate kinase [Bacteroidetes bacterium]|nr:MAG: guanylate kinase [Bacteroidota bacterium]